MNHNPLNLRPATASDSQLLFDWVREPKVRKMSINNGPISWSEHQAWFHSKLTDNFCKLYIGCADKKPIGQIRFDIEGLSATTDISLDFNYRSRGLGVQLLISGIEKLRREVSIEKIYATVKKDNIASKKIFEKAGFLIQTQHSIKNAIQHSIQNATDTLVLEHLISEHTIF